MNLARIAVLSVLLSPTFACRSSYSERISDFENLYRSANFAAAEQAVDDRIAQEAELEISRVRDARFLAQSPECATGDAFLYLLEKAMARLAQQDAAGALVLLRRARDEMDARTQASAADFLESTILDDTYRSYRAFDHELLMVRSLIALCDLIEGGQDAFPLALDIAGKQRELIEAGFGAEVDWNYRLLYPRIAFGSYLEGVLLESKQRAPEAVKAYRNAQDDGCDAKLIAAGLQRARSGRYTANPGHGVVHVFFLLGSSPTLIETTHPPTDMGRMLAGVAITLVADSASAAMQVPIRVPQVSIRDEYVVPVDVAVDGRKVAMSEPLIDLNGIVSEELDAMMEWIIARAMVRRAVKAAAAATLESVLRKNFDSKHGDDIAFLAGSILNMGTTAVENADTRSWTALPAQLHATRIELPSGVHQLAFGSLSGCDVRVSAGHDAFVMVIMPDPSLPAAVIVDRESR